MMLERAMLTMLVCGLAGVIFNLEEIRSGDDPVAATYYVMGGICGLIAAVGMLLALFLIWRMPRGNA